MKKENLILLGAAAQKKFNLSDECAVEFIAPNAAGVIHLSVHDKRGFMGYGIEVVCLETFGSTDGRETARVGYSKHTKVLFVELPKKVKS